ncbi:amidohydrolase family protein [Muriicola sp. SD30]|uniref:amidohydrolase family protein n=1 Tax=Muriicola sp. SD30 TaxID=3240936 RepID=UPI00350FF701
MKQLFLLIFIIFSSQTHSQSIDTLQFSMMLGGDKAGFLKQWKNPDGSFTEWFQYNDRGRGDSTVTNYRYNDKNYIVSIDAMGVDYYKKPIFEKFYKENDTAFWENSSEKGQKKFVQNASYIPLNISAGMSFKNYFVEADSTIQLLPSGKSKLSVLSTYKLKSGKEIRLISTRGSGLTPSYAWIDENAEFFASPGNWFSLFRTEYEFLNEELLKIQDEYSNNYFKDAAKKVTSSITDGLLIKNANLYNAKTGKINSNISILIENGRIIEVVVGQYKSPKGYRTIDAKGKFVMPGLWDMHVHYTSPAQGVLHLACGVTNVRDMGNAIDLLDTKKKIDDGIVLGPRIQIMSGFIDGAGEFAGPIGEKISSIEEGTVAIKKYADLGYQQIKLYSSIKPEWVAPLTEIARKYNLRVSGHIPSFMLASEAIEAGYDEIQHMNMLFLNFLGKDIDTRTPARFSAVAQNAAAFDFEKTEFKDFIKQLKSRDITIEPTVSIFEGMFIGKAGKPDPSYANIIHRLPLNIQRSFKTGSSLEIPPGMENTYEQSFLNMLKFIKVLYDNQVTILPGTDAFAGFTLIRELENYVRAGIPNEEVLKMATLTSAKIAGKADNYGTIEIGKIADLIIIDGNPIENIKDLNKIEIVIKDTSLYKTKDLFELLSIEYFK